MKKYLIGFAAVFAGTSLAVGAYAGGYGITLTSNPSPSSKYVGSQYGKPTVKIAVGNTVTFHRSLQTSAADAAGERLEGTFSWNIDPRILSCPWSTVDVTDITCTMQTEGSTEVSVTFNHTMNGEAYDSVTSDAIFVMTPPTPPAPRSIPSAGYEDQVLTNTDAYQNPFPDTDMNQLAGKSAAELFRRGVIGGFPDGQFKGSLQVNRAEAAKFLLLARYGTVADVSNSGKFPDVLDRQWYTKFVVTAANKGIINGYPDGTFRPADQVNTAEFLKMLSLTFGLQLNLGYSYTDVPADSWFAQYAGITQKYNLFPNRLGILSPDSPLSREDVAIAIYSYLSNR